MLYIACCDDDSLWLEQFVQQISRLLDGRGVAARVRAFSDSRSLLQALSGPEPIDVLFLDVLLGDADGIDVAGGIRRLRPRLPVVLVSVSPEFALEGYRVHAAHYLLKPVTDDALLEALDYCASLPAASGYLVVRWRRADRVLPVSEILYIEVLDYQLRIHTRTSGVLSTNGHLSQLERKLPEGQFLRCHKSYLVNLAYVKGIRRYHLLLSSGQSIPVSKQNYNAVRQAYLQNGGRHIF